MWIGIVALLLIAGLPSLTSCAADAAPSGSRSSAEAQPIALSDGWLAMGTFFEVDLRLDAGAGATAEAEARAWLGWARAEIARLERIYSRHAAESELSALNRFLAEAEAGGPTIPIGPELGRILALARSLSRETDGAFDVTIGPWIDLWKDAAASGDWPSGSALRAVAGHVGAERFDLETCGSMLCLRSKGPGLRLDLDGVSKGVVLDHLRQSLHDRMPTAAALLSFGQSSLWAIGDAEEGGQGWTLEIRSRDPTRGGLGRIRLRDRALSMSSSLGSGIEVGGRIVSHVVDPDSGLAVEGTLEAVVVADTAAKADAWSTALLVLGARESPATTLNRLEAEGLEGRLLDSAGASWTTTGWPRAANDSAP